MDRVYKKVFINAQILQQNLFKLVKVWYSHSQTNALCYVTINCQKNHILWTTLHMCNTYNTYYICNINNMRHKPLRSVLMSTDSGTVIPSRFFPSPVPALQPILSRRTFPMPPVNGAARVNVSWHRSPQY